MTDEKCATGFRMKSPTEFIWKPRLDSNITAMSASSQCRSVVRPLGSSSTRDLPQPIAFEDTHYFEKLSALDYNEARLIRYYSQHLSRWLDCTDGSRQFALAVPQEAKHCPVLRCTILAFATCYRGDDTAAQAAYQESIMLLTHRLEANPTSHDERLLCAMVILNFCKELLFPPNSVPEAGQHIARCAAILRNSQGDGFVDPSTPTLREAAFWVYVRQCIYDSTINQVRPDLNFLLQLRPNPASMQKPHNTTRLQLGTAWANQATWNTACVADFCFGGAQAHMEPINKNQEWQRLWDKNIDWLRERPSEFDPIWEGHAESNSGFPEVWFVADYHALAFGFYHFACVMLLLYKPGPKFAFRILDSELSDIEKRILEHARAICSICKSSPEIVPISMLLCHSVFIWGPLLYDPQERDEVIHLLVKFEADHLWPTRWIVDGLKKQWGVDRVLFFQSAPKILSVMDAGRPNSVDP